MTEPLVSIRDLKVTFTGGAKPVRAVAGVDLSLARGECSRSSASPARARA
jgi:ABC-type dipeptide/oligopeptide/nickel transport system ATPase component